MGQKRYALPGTGHSGTRNGLTPETAWGTWSEIVWSSLRADDELVMLDAWTAQPTLNIGAHAGTVSHPVKIRGDFPGRECSIAFTASNSFMGSRSNTRIIGFANLPSVAFLGQVSNAWVEDTNMVASGSVSAILYSGGTGDDFVNCGLRNVNISCAVTPATQSAIRWFCSTGARSTMTGLILDNVNISGYQAPRSVIQFRSQTDSDPATRMQDITCKNVTITDYAGTAIEFTSPGTSGLVDTSAGIFIDNINLKNGIPGSTGLGGGIGVHGFGWSLTLGFERNYIQNINAENVVGPTGMLDLFFGAYITRWCTADGLSTLTVDGNGILYDFSCHDCEDYENYFRNLTGKSGVNNSGCAIMMLEDCLRIYSHDNVAENVLTGIFYGAPGVATSSKVERLIALNLQNQAIYASSTTVLTDMAVDRCFFSGNGYRVRDTSPSTWVKETNNYFCGFSSGNVGHTDGAGSVVIATPSAIKTRLTKKDIFDRQPQYPAKRAGSYIVNFLESSIPTDVPNQFKAFDPLAQFALVRGKNGESLLLQNNVLFNQNGKLVAFWGTDVDGEPVAYAPSLGLDRSLTATTTAQSLMLANTTRRGFYLVNDALVDVWINMGGTASASAGGGNIKIAAGSKFSMKGVCSTAPVSIISASSTAAITAREF